jgi:hypothetical protein
LSRYIAKCKYILKMIQIIAKLDEVLRLHFTISITIEKFDSRDFTKTSWQVFHSNEHKCVYKKRILKKLLLFEKWQKLCVGLYIKNHFIYVSKH